MMGSGKKFDLDPEDEVNLGKYAKEKYDSDFIFVTHFPSSKPLSSSIASANLIDGTSFISGTSASSILSSF